MALISCIKHTVHFSEGGGSVRPTVCPGSSDPFNIVS